MSCLPLPQRRSGIRAGDTNVPAGEVTFRCKVARRHRVEHRDTYPPEFGVTARYRAEGQIAGPSFSDKRWAPPGLLTLATAWCGVVSQWGRGCTVQAMLGAFGPCWPIVAAC